ncbi:MAG: hypothetical protein R3B06_29520 [Kofleriaceae bacterium]
MEMNQAVAAVEALVAGFRGALAGPPREVRVRPSGDAPDHIKVWADLGPGVDAAACAAWAAACKEAVAVAAAPWAVEVRAESL